MIDLRPILLIEDNEDDAFFMQRAVKAAEIDRDLKLVTDGAAAIEFFGQAETIAGPGKPCLILLDLKLPYKNGLEVLSWLKSQKKIQDIPVMVLTSSSEPSDIEKSMELGASAYVVKPSSSAELVELANAIKNFWLRFHRSL